MGTTIRALDRRGHYVDVWRPTTEGEPSPEWPSPVWPGCPTCAATYEILPVTQPQFVRLKLPDGGELVGYSSTELAVVSRARINHDPILHDPDYDPFTRKRHERVVVSPRRRALPAGEDL